MPDRRLALLVARRLAAIALLAGGSTAYAHPGALAHDHAGFLAGLLHPLTGADHLAAMVALGAWSALAMRPAWLAPVAFLAFLAAGALAGFAGLAVPAVEPMIAASLLVLGLLAARRQALAWPAAASLAGVFAFFHGAAHGAELAGSSPLGALAGILLASAALHLAGMAVARVVARASSLRLSSGAAVGAFGAALLLRLA